MPKSHPHGAPTALIPGKKMNTWLPPTAITMTPATTALWTMTANGSSTATTNTKKMTRKTATATPPPPPPPSPPAPTIRDKSSSLTSHRFVLLKREHDSQCKLGIASPDCHAIPSEGGWGGARVFCCTWPARLSWQRGTRPSRWPGTTSPGCGFVPHAPVLGQLTCAESCEHWMGKYWHLGNC